MNRRTSLSIILSCAVLAAALITSSAGAASSKKIVALTPFSANTLVYTGKKPVAIGAMAVGHKGISTKLKGVKQLTLSHPNGPNMEQIAKINPDIVLTSGAWRKGTQTMRDLAITVREMDPSTVGQVVPKIRAIGNAYGSKKLTDKLAKSTAAEISYATKGSKKSPHPIKTRPKVLLILGVGRTPYIFLNNSWGGSVAKAAGANLLGGDLKDSGGFAQVSDEYVVAQNPDIIIGVPHGNASELKSISEYMLNNPAWATTNAVKNKQVFTTLDDALLQPNVDAGDTIKRLRVAYLKNW
ncbi:MAG: ABC transporter substrate-binding protein [Solirubrobacterales bacterium]